MNRQKQEERHWAIEELRPRLSQGERIWGSVVNVSPSGMNRSIRFYVISHNNIVELPPRLIAAATGDSYDKNRDAVRVNGCGMDMVLATIRSLGVALHDNPRAFECKYL